MKTFGLICLGFSLGYGFCWAHFVWNGLIRSKEEWEEEMRVRKTMKMVKEKSWEKNERKDKS